MTSDLFADVILGRQFLIRYSEITFCYGRSDPPLRIPRETQMVLGVATAKLKSSFLDPGCKLFAVKSRRYSREDSDFIKSEIKQLLEADVIAPANSPWRVQILVVIQTGGKKRLYVDYSVIIFTYLIIPLQ